MILNNERTRSCTQVRNMYGLDDAVSAILLRLDRLTLQHAVRTRYLSMVIGSKLGLTERELNQLCEGALLHDVGKQVIPLGILMKQSPLTKEEWALIQTHPQCGYDYLASLPVHEHVRQMVLQHHRWANGQGGYPQNVGNRCPCLLTQIISVADVVDAMTHSRPYRVALSKQDCLDFLEKHQNTRFNADVVKVVKELLLSKR